jgi:hypothetical protein
MIRQGISADVIEKITRYHQYTMASRYEKNKQDAKLGRIRLTQGGFTEVERTSSSLYI